MSADYGSATINNMATTGPPGGPAVQPPIGWDRLTAANTEMWNDHIGTDEGVSVLAADGLPGTRYVAQLGTPGRDDLGALMTWCTCVAGCAAGNTGTITANAFVVGAGTSVAKAAIAANGFGWVKN